MSFVIVEGVEGQRLARCSSISSSVQRLIDQQRSLIRRRIDQQWRISAHHFQSFLSPHLEQVSCTAKGYTDEVGSALLFGSLVWLVYSMYSSIRLG